jgi:hypothetical protein
VTIFGRDHKMRPCLMFDFGALVEDIKKKTLDMNAMANAVMLT